ncbi:MAG TPA: ribosome biogenesis GTPase YlqF [Candidatus Mediterraneibacter merdipullorum]|nr:ribosome biogenesis GTPase YlqF [Candidatus Mediterraneibacter merdipullorum]
MHFQWYPGHMTKARRMMQENIRLIDLIIELVDARIPASSRNPDIDELGKGKARLVLLNKADLADDCSNDVWVEYFRDRGYTAVKVNSRKGGGIKSIQSAIQEACREKTERDRKRGILNRPVRAMVVGIPNVGKSTFINALAGKACAKTGNRPGVTKGKQWIRLNKNVELLDTPGILWPKFEDQEVGLKLAFIGSIKDEILQTEELAAELIKYLDLCCPGAVARKYAIPDAGDPYGCLREIAKSRHCLVRGSELDTEKAASILLDDFRDGRLGRITLEMPDGPGENMPGAPAGKTPDASSDGPAQEGQRK